MDSPLLFLSGLLYSKSSEILVVLRKFFDGTSILEGEKSMDVNVSSTALFSKLGNTCNFVNSSLHIGTIVFFISKKLVIVLGCYNTVHNFMHSHTGEFVWPDLFEIIISECLKRSVPNTSAQVP